MSAGGAAAGAAAARRRMQQEEETMTSYSPQDLADGWEFKMLRSMRGAFKDSERLKQILAEEGRAGWTLIEKFDNGRIRLKRQTSCRDLDTKVEFDPYRTFVGPSETQFVIGVIALVICAMIGVMVLIAVIVNINNNAQGPPPPRIVAPAQAPN